MKPKQDGRSHTAMAEALAKVNGKFWQADQYAVDTITSIVINAFENKHYSRVLEEISHLGIKQLEQIANVLNEFGLCDKALLSREVSRRINLLDEFELLINNPRTKEQIIHHFLEINLWVFGYEFSLLSSNSSLQKITSIACNKIYKGQHPRRRPDLFLGVTSKDEKVLIEFKRPFHILIREDEAQAQRYRDELSNLFPNDRIFVRLYGREVEGSIRAQSYAADLSYHTYHELLVNARDRYEWLLVKKTK